MLTKTEEIILELFVSNITKSFSINQVAKLIDKPYPLTHRSIKNLVKYGLLLKDDRKLLSLNYKDNFEELVYAEYNRKEKKLKNHKLIQLFIKDCLKEIKLDFFVFLIFGSFAEKNNFRDLDILIIVEDKKEVDNIEKLITNISANFSIKVDLNVIFKESAYEMFIKREQANIMNESLNKHLIIFGGENYYRILKNAR